MNKTVITVAGIVAVLIILVIVAQPEAPARDAVDSRASVGVIGDATSLTLNESSFDFGSISMAAGMVRRTFTMKNSDTKPVRVTNIYTSCMCTNAILRKNGSESGPFGMPGHGLVPRVNEELAPGENAEIEVVFDPAAHGPAGVGPIERAVYLETDAGQKTIIVKALVTP